MSLITSEKSNYVPLKQGTYSSVCIGMADIGTMTGPFGSQQKLWIQWEVDEQNAAGERYTISKLYTNSISRKAKLREHLEAWRGQGFTADELSSFDLTAILGTPCLLTIGNTSKDGRTYDSVEGVAKLPRGMPAVTPGRDLIQFDMDNPDLTVLEKLPEWLRRQIEQSPEFRTTPAPEQKAPPKAIAVDEVAEDLEEMPF